MSATTNLVVTDELEAVNTMLRAIGEAPISDLDEPQLLSAVNAKNTLRRVSREMQTTGWVFNTEFAVTMSVDGDSKIPVGNNVLMIDSFGQDCHKQVTRRGGFLYDLENHTFIFGGSVNAEVVYFLSFTDLPEAARNFITVKAAREFQASDIGVDVAKFGFNEEDEVRARALLRRFEGKTGDTNILTGSHSVNRIIDRRLTGNVLTNR